MPPCGGAPKLQRVEQEAEALLGVLGSDPDQLEDLLLDVDAMVADRAAADLVAVEHEVVGAREQRRRDRRGPRRRPAAPPRWTGAVNGWCSASQRSPSASWWNIGKRTIQRMSWTPSGTSEKRRASSRRSAPSTAAATAPLSATRNSTSPSAGTEPLVDRRDLRLRTGTWRSASATPTGPPRTPTPAPWPRTAWRSSVSASSSERGSSRTPALIPRTTPPELQGTGEDLELGARSQGAAEVGELQPEPGVGAVRAEAAHRLGVGHLRPRREPAPRTPPARRRRRSPTRRARVTSSSSTKPISMSSWVNSAIRSARESSSRKQRTIW